jgi:hypothetical protein
MRTCCCTNQCPACGQCCQVNCGHRTAPSGVSTTGTGIQIGKATPAAPRPLTEDDIRRILREELGRSGG